jgi:hypothetical protein
MPFPHTCITRILRPVSCASCSRMCLVGFGVALNAAFRVSTSIMNSPQSSPEPIKEDETSLLKISSDSNHSTQSCDTNGNSIHPNWVSNCFALIVVLGPRRLEPAVEFPFVPSIASSPERLLSGVTLEFGWIEFPLVSQLWVLWLESEEIFNNDVSFSLIGSGRKTLS